MNDEQLKQYQAIESSVARAEMAKATLRLSLKKNQAELQRTRNELSILLGVRERDNLMLEGLDVEIAQLTLLKEILEKGNADEEQTNGSA